MLAVTISSRAEDLSQVKKLYVDSLGHSKNAVEMRTHIVRRLRRSSEIQVVSNLKNADAVVKCDGQIWTVGLDSLSPRSQSARGPILQGFLSHF